MKKVLGSVFIASAFIATTVFASGNEVKVGNLKIENPQARATVPAQKMSGGFLKIENKGGADRLLSASSPASKTM
jgi:copper(I)-binding protein